MLPKPRLRVGKSCGSEGMIRGAGEVFRGNLRGENLGGFSQRFFKVRDGGEGDEISLR